MTAFVLAIMIATYAPTPADRLADWIASTSPRAAPYAGELAARILYESQVHDLDPALFAAIGYLESRYRLYPHGGGPQTHQAALWQVYPSREWLAIPRAQRLRLSQSLVWSTWRAASILAYHVSRCRGGGPACYCRYNRRPCRRGYMVALYQRGREIRRILSGS